MKFPGLHLRIVSLLVAFAIAGITQIACTRSTGDSTYSGLRDLALKASPADLNLRLDGDEVVAYGMLMDIGLPSGTATVTSFASGDASLYLSSGGGILGGIGYESVRNAAKMFVEDGQKFLANMERVLQFPLPQAGDVRFYVITNHGVYASAEVPDDDLAHGRGELSPLFRAGQDVIAEMRRSVPNAL